MEVPQLPLVQFLVVIDMPVVFVTTGACAGPDNDRCRFVETVQKTVDAPQLLPLLDKVVDVPVLATSWGSRGSAAAVHRLVISSSFL